MKYFSNRDIAKLLRDIAAVYSVKGENNFKIIAYNNAADSVENATRELKELWEDKKLNSVSGLGKSIQSHLDELFKTGHVKHFDEVKKGFPPVMFDLINLAGMGPKNAYKLSTTLKIKSIGELETAAKEGKIRAIPTFGQKSEKEILASILEFQGKNDRYNLPFTASVAQRVIDHIKKLGEAKEVEPLGSLRRMVSTIGDVDIAVASNEPAKIINHFKSFRETARVVTSGDVSSSMILQNGMRIDLKIQPPEAFGALLQHFTGSKYHNIALREYALKNKMSLSEYGIKYKGKLHKFANEADFYHFLNLDYIEPELRENTGEIEAAKNHTLPELIDTQNINGDLHIHSNYPIEPSHDLGKNSFEQLIERALELNYQYVGLSDHSPGASTHTKKQIIELIKKRTKKIEQINTSFKNIRVYNLLEIDILTSGELSVPQEGLEMLDFAIAGIHSSHNQPKDQITKRLMAAIDNPKVKIISHPTGRIIGERNSYEADWETVFKKCVKTKTYLEINSWATRLDLPDTLVRLAKSLGVKFVINSDAHAVSHMDNIKFGVSVARRGWCTKDDVLNTCSYIEFSRHFGLS